MLINQETQVDATVRKAKMRLFSETIRWQCNGMKKYMNFSGLNLRYSDFSSIFAHQIH